MPKFTMRPSGKLPFELTHNDGKLKVTKVEAAVRQLETAIELWASDGDPVSINTLAHAAHEIIYRLNKGSASPGGSLADADPTFLTPQGLKIWPLLFNLDYNFSKHGGSDPNEVHHLTIENTPFTIMDAVRMFNSLGFADRAYFRGFSMWMWITKSEIFLMKPAALGIDNVRVDALVAGGKKEFFYFFRDGLHGLAAKGSPVVKNPPL